MLEAREKHLRPALGRPPVPSLRHKLVNRREAGRNGRVEVLTALHDDRRVANRGVLQDTNWLVTIRTTTVRQRRVVQGQAHIEGDDGVEA